MKTMLLYFTTVVMAFAQPKILIQDDFSSNFRSWPVDEHKSIADGILTLNTPEDGDQAFISFFLDAQKDYVVAADVTQKAGLANEGFGIVWGASDEFYNLFLISSDQQYAIFSGNPAQLKKMASLDTDQTVGATQSASGRACSR